MALKTYTTIVTHLEMTAEPQLPQFTPAANRYALLRAVTPPVHFYRYLHDTVGEPYIWLRRKQMSDTDLLKIIHDSRVEIFILYCDGVPAGFVELDFRNMPIADLALAGLVPEFIGRGLGAYLIGEAIKIAWSRAPDKLIVQTCTLDHPRALPLYQRLGFTPIGREEVTLSETTP